MSHDLVPHQATHLSDPQNAGKMTEFITMSIDGQLFGISVYPVQDVLAAQNVSSIPLAPPEVAGSLNLRGRIVTAIDVRVRLGLPPLDDRTNRKSIVVEHKEELYSLLVDSVGDVLNLPVNKLNHTPENVSNAWQEVALGVYPLDSKLLIILDVGKLLRFGPKLA